MGLLRVILVSLLISPSTWILLGALIYVSVASTPATHWQTIIVWAAIAVVAVLEVREFAMDAPWLVRDTPPPGLKCTVQEWNDAFVGKPMFALQFIATLLIRLATIALLLWHQFLR